MPELTEGGFEVLRAAVRSAHDLQIKSVDALRKHLSIVFPKREGDIDAAINYWSCHVKARGISNH